MRFGPKLIWLGLARRRVDRDAAASDAVFGRSPPTPGRNGG